MKISSENHSSQTKAKKLNISLLLDPGFCHGVFRNLLQTKYRAWVWSISAKCHFPWCR